MTSTETEVHHVKTTVRGRYAFRQAVAQPAVATLIGFHGYAETAEIHLSELLTLPDLENVNLAAIQALNRFYKKSGEVVASWMTSQDRELAIEDNLLYAKSTITAISSRLCQPSPIAFIGFSQGASMAYRACLASDNKPLCLIIVGGDCPPEYPQQDLSQLPPVLICRGSEDPFFTTETLERDLELLSQQGVAVTTLTYHGKHHWTNEMRTEITAFIRLNS